MQSSIEVSDLQTTASLSEPIYLPKRMCSCWLVTCSNVFGVMCEETLTFAGWHLQQDVQVV